MKVKIRPEVEIGPASKNPKLMNLCSNYCRFISSKNNFDKRRCVLFNKPLRIKNYTGMVLRCASCLQAEKGAEDGK